MASEMLKAVRYLTATIQHQGEIRVYNSVGKWASWGVYRALKMPVFPLLEEFSLNDRIPLDQLKAMQFEKIRQHLQHAVSSSPYYRRLFRSEGIEIEDIRTFEDFRQIPVLTKAEMKRSKEEIVISPKPSGLIKAKTSGSTGIPLAFYKTPEDMAATYALQYRGHRWHEVDIGTTEARLWGVPISRSQRYRSKVSDFLFNRFRQNSLVANDEVYSAFYRTMVRRNPQYLMGYPSFLSSFSSFIKESGLDGRRFRLKFVKYTAEMLYASQKRIIEDVFGCKCISEYGSAETGVVSFECPAGNNHQMMDAVHIDFEKDDLFEITGQYRLIITNLYSRAFPVIRYEIGDMSEPVSSTCACGRTLPLISQIHGRINDQVVGKNGTKYHSFVFSYILKDVITLGVQSRKIRFVQNAPGEIEAQVSCDSDLFTHLETVLRISAGKVFADNIDFHVNKYDEVPSDKSGKFRYFIPLNKH